MGRFSERYSGSGRSLLCRRSCVSDHKTPYEMDEEIVTLTDAELVLVNADKKRISLQENRSNKFIRDGKEQVIVSRVMY
jgi:hypothetical protein